MKNNKMRQQSTYTRSEEQDGRGAGLSATPGERGCSWKPQTEAAVTETCPDIKAGSRAIPSLTRVHLITQLKCSSVKTGGGGNLLDEMHKPDTVAGNFNSSENPLGPAAKHTEKRDSQSQEKREVKLESTSSRPVEEL